MPVWKEAAQETGFSTDLMDGMGRLLSLLGPRPLIYQMEAILTLLPQAAGRVKCELHADFLAWSSTQMLLRRRTTVAAWLMKQLQTA